MRLALYTRVSTTDQDAKAQVARLREWAAKMGHEIHSEESDVASGRHVQRPGMERIMQAARGHQIHAVAVAKVDRWARSIQHLSSTVNELHALSVDFYAIDQGLTVRKADPTSTLILNVLGAVAQWEASIIAERTKDSLKGKAGRGRHWKDCGSELHPCPTGKHKSNGMQVIQGEEAQKPGGSTNVRLIEAPSNNQSHLMNGQGSEAETASGPEVKNERPEVKA